MTSPDEGNEEGITYVCTLCGDSGWLVPDVSPLHRTASHCCVCPAGLAIAKELGGGDAGAQPARLPGI